MAISPNFNCLAFIVNASILYLEVWPVLSTGKSIYVYWWVYIVIHCVKTLYYLSKASTCPDILLELGNSNHPLLHTNICSLPLVSSGSFICCITCFQPCNSTELIVSLGPRSYNFYEQITCPGSHFMQRYRRDALCGAMNQLFVGTSTGRILASVLSDAVRKLSTRSQTKVSTPLTGTTRAV